MSFIALLSGAEMMFIAGIQNSTSNIDSKKTITLRFMLAPSKIKVKEDGAGGCKHEAHGDRK